MADTRPIDANALFDALYDNEFQTFCPLDEVSDVIAAAPTLDYAPVRHGEWERMDEYCNHSKEFRCTSCKQSVFYDHFTRFCEYDYCPNCGAKMDGGKENE